MKSKTQFFNGTLFGNTIKRFWPLFAAYLVIWLIILPLSLNGQLNWASEYPENDIVLVAAEKVMTSGTVFATLMAAAFGLFFAMVAFYYLYNNRSVSMICSLPYKREGIFIPLFSTGLVTMFVSNIIVFLVTILVESSYEALDMFYLWQWLGMVSLNCLFFYGFAVFCASLTGNIFVLPFVYLVLNFTVIVVEIFARLILDGVYYGISDQTTPVLGFMSPLYDLLINSDISLSSENLSNGDLILQGYSFDNWTTLIIYGAVGIIFAVLALILIKHRHMETAGDVVAVKPLKPIFKYCMTFGCALVLGVVINSIVFYNSNHYFGYGNFTILVGCMIFGAFIGYFAAEMLIQKTLRVFAGKTWIGFAVSCLVIIALLLSCEFDVFGFERNIPEKDEVESVSISGYSFQTISLENSENIQSVIDLHKSIIANKAMYESHTNASYSENLYISYFLKKGKVFTREYTLFYDIDDYNTLNDIINSSEAVEYRKHLNIPITEETFSMGYIGYSDNDTGEYIQYDLTNQEAVELYNDCIIPDIDSGAMGNIWLNPEKSKVNGSSYYSTVYDCEIYFELSKRVGEVEYNYDSFRTYVTVDAENTLAWLYARDIKPVMMDDSQSADIEPYDTDVA